MLTAKGFLFRCLLGVICFSPAGAFACGCPWRPFLTTAPQATKVAHVVVVRTEIGIRDAELVRLRVLHPIKETVIDEELLLSDGIPMMCEVSLMNEKPGTELVVALWKKPGALDGGEKGTFVIPDCTESTLSVSKGWVSGGIRGRYVTTMPIDDFLLHYPLDSAK